jgi:peptide/nickel transport system permease protein
MKTLREVLRYPSAVAGLAIIAALVGLSIYTIITLPYSEAIRLWRGGEETWHENPKNAQPAWVNLFRKSKLPETIILNSQDGSATKNVKAVSAALTDVTISFAFDYPYDAFPQELNIYFTSVYSEQQPLVSLSWLTPDGREIRMGDFSIKQAETYRASQDERLTRRLKGQAAMQGLFADPAANTPAALKGRYELRIEGNLFEKDAALDAKLVLHGQVYGLAGTDHRRRDLTVALLWGTPIALGFGLLAAFGSTFTTMVIAAIGVWFGRWADGIIQRITEVHLILPVLPILIMIGTFYSRSIWLILGVVIILNIFGAQIKTYRAVFIQVKDAPYIEAARAYGAGSWRIILRYLVPRVVPMLVPQLVVLIPSFVFLEASLAVLGLGDPVLPTWGKAINDAYTNGALFQKQYYWVLEPSVLLILTGLAFAMVGFALDRISNPRLRGM